MFFSGPRIKCGVTKGGGVIPCCAPHRVTLDRHPGLDPGTSQKSPFSLSLLICVVFLWAPHKVRGDKRWRCHLVLRFASRGVLPSSRTGSGNQSNITFIFKLADLRCFALRSASIDARPSSRTGSGNQSKITFFFKLADLRCISLGPASSAG